MAPYESLAYLLSWWCSGWALDSRSKGRWFDSRPGRYVISAFHPSGVGKSSTSLHGWGEAARVHLCRVAGNTVIPYGKWRPVALRWSVIKSYIVLCTCLWHYINHLFTYLLTCLNVHRNYINKSTCRVTKATTATLWCLTVIGMLTLLLLNDSYCSLWTTVQYRVGLGVF